MKIKKSIVALGLVASMFTAGFSVAGDDKNIKRALILESFNTDLAEIVKAKEVAGVNVVEVELDKRESLFSSKEEGMVYELITSDGKDKRVKYYIDPVTGKDIDSKSISNWNPFDDDVKVDTKISMSQAMDLAVKKLGGRVFEAELEEDDGISYYEIKILTDAGVKKAVVHPQTGLVIVKKNKKKDHERD